jgi:uncharacterized protein YbjT (DUF2867 family)
VTSILLAGATGLVGGHALSALLAHPGVSRVHVLSRRPIPRAHPKLEVHEVDFSRSEAWEAPERIAVAASCLGTTIRKAGSQAAFRAVDEGAVLALAEAARRAGAHRFVSVSAIGASATARVFYSRVKGEVEDALAARTGSGGFASMVLLQPSLLTGDRREFRPGEALADWLSRPIAPLMTGWLGDYRPIPAQTVARALVSVVTAPPDAFTGVVRLKGAAMVQLAEAD